MTEGEHKVLSRLVFRAMDPLDRARWGTSADILTEDEKRTLHSLSQSEQG